MRTARTHALLLALAWLASRRDVFAGVGQSQETLKRIDVTRP